MISNVTKKNEETAKTSLHKLSLHIGIGIGETIELLVGGFRGNFEFLISGEALEDAGAALKKSEKNEVVISKALWDIAPQLMVGIAGPDREFLQVTNLKLSLDTEQNIREKLLDAILSDAPLIPQILLAAEVCSCLFAYACRIDVCSYSINNL
jgi:hypothetical protein